MFLLIIFDSFSSSAIFAYVDGDYYNLEIEFKDDKNQLWQFIPPDPNQQSIYQNTITLRGGDFNLDGYPDMLVTLKMMTTGIVQTFLMENVACGNCAPLTRSFAIRWNAFAPYSNGTVVGAFYDFYQVIFSFRRQSTLEDLDLEIISNFFPNFQTIFCFLIFKCSNCLNVSPLGRYSRRDFCEAASEWCVQASGLP